MIFFVCMTTFRAINNSIAKKPLLWGNIAEKINTILEWRVCYVYSCILLFIPMKEFFKVTHCNQSIYYYFKRKYLAYVF